MSEASQAPQIDGAELAKQLGKAAVQGSVDVISGRKQTSALKWAVIVFRILGVAVFIMAVFKLWWFEYYALGVGWFKTMLTGLVIGFALYCHGELINLFISIEGHLNKLANKLNSQS
jgi:hypothetical protein